MSTNPQPTKQSRWGGFLQQAIAGVESRLDTILADQDEEDGVKDVDKGGKPPPQPSLQAPMSFAKSVSPAPARSPSTTRANDRLQERLARAMAKRESATGSPISPTETLSRATSPLPGHNHRTSLDTVTAGGDTSAMRYDSASMSSSPIPRSSQDVQPPPRTSNDIRLDADEKPNGSHIEDGQRETRPSGDGHVISRAVENSVPKIGVTEPTETSTDDYEEAMAQMRADHEMSKLRWQEELHAYVERIDALQSKLKYLANEAAESAKNAAASAEAGSLEKKLLEKDEQIANLMEEGQKLSKTEMDHRATIKKLRQSIAESAKSQTETKKRLEKVEKDLVNAEDRASQAEIAERKALERLNSVSKAEKQLETATAEREASNATITDLKSQLARAVSRAEAAERKARMEASEAEKRQIAELRDDLSSAKIEREISEEKLRREIRDLKEGIEREKERARIREIELRGEQSVLESKMESLRSRAEEVSSSATGESHAKLLRQIEVLQTQYAVASENWHGIEGSLIARLTAVETERDELERREGDLRRKAREASLKAKKVEGELENSRAVIQEIERNLEASKQEIQSLTRKLTKAENDFLVVKQDLAKQKEVELTLIQRLEEERARWQELARRPSSPFLQEPPTGSPITFNRKQMAGPDPTRPMSDRALSRRSSSIPPALFSELTTPPYQNHFSPTNSNPQQPRITPSHEFSGDLTHAQTYEPEEYFNGMSTPVTPSAQGTHTHHSRGVNDIISVSTVAAGPSVQVVERMSTTIRRLESERAAFKDEIVRLTAQRDEARQEVVELMREVEEKRKCDQRIQELEATVEQLDQRYQTTLEMLGEKSELVEELKADISDLKKIYRELVDSTMK
ncbi:M protein repeat protein [Histoplasma ohiense]|nr:M protein repeat protein [Histoplasma ohiense (nom. inval.)]